MRMQCKCHQTCAMLKSPLYRVAKHVMKRKETSGSLLTSLLTVPELAMFGRAMPFKMAIGREVLGLYAVISDPPVKQC
jgi:hypothetical protein